ncbi:MAG: acetyl-CoA carboxylase carboxyltransferase subunit beta [Hyphomicrobiaceae bacterium]|nr:acetyl-CoA carboxylase carboxyltransferase subunit beta [Hyphomicrobiaceae bacterium]MCC0006768.1 acetyl-CoA carboxylase carboxyltransferase subunit beta [Hyphomicrobiaceae bacterium]
MNWINNVVRPKIRSFLTTKRDVPDDLWRKCPETGQMVFTKDLVANQYVFPGSDYHDRMTAPQRLEHLFGAGNYAIIPNPPVALDPLKFRDAKRYTDRLKEAKTKTELEDAVVVAEGDLDGTNVVVAVQDFRFMAGSLGMAAGEAVIAGMEHAVSKKAPFVLFAASGGARMQEGIMSLMQMPRTTIAVQRLRDARLPYIVVLTDPTTGGVTASYAMLGDVHIAEPGALICFAGPRVIQQTIREQLPDGFQRAEYLRDHGMVDMVVHRHKLRPTLARLVRVLMAPAASATASDSARKAARASNGKGPANGADSDATGKAPAAKPPAIIEAEPVAENERFEAGRRLRSAEADARPPDDPKTAAPKTAPKS